MGAVLCGAVPWRPPHRPVDIVTAVVVVVMVLLVAVVVAVVVVLAVVMVVMVVVVVVAFVGVGGVMVVMMVAVLVLVLAVVVMVLVVAFGVQNRLSRRCWGWWWHQPVGVRASTFAPLMRCVSTTHLGNRVVLVSRIEAAIPSDTTLLFVPPPPALPDTDAQTPFGLS